MTIYFTEKEIRKTIVIIYRDLKKDFDILLGQGQQETIAYDVGYINSLCNILGKHNLGRLIYNKFMHN